MTAAALDRRPPPDPRLLQRCLLLAVLLHVWLVLIFGNATGVAEPGQGVWGSLTVKLLGRSGGDAGAPPADAAQRQPRQTTPPAAPGAAELGRPNPREVAAEAARSDEVSPAAPSTATLELPEGFRPIERQDLSPPPRSALPQMPPPELPTTAVGRLESRPDDLARPLAPAASLRAPSRPAELPAQPADLPAPVHRLDNATASPSTTATLPRPTELRPLPTPAAAVAAADELPPPVSRLEAPTAPSVATPLPRPAELRTVPSRIAAPDAQATTLPAPVQRLEAVDTGAAAVTPLTRPSELRPPGSSGATAPTALPSRQDLPTAVQRLESAEAGSGVTPLQPLPGARASLPAPGAAMLGELAGSLPGQVAAPAGPARGDPNASPVAAPRASLGTPDAGSRLGPDLPSPPSAAASAPRAPLNLSLPRGDIAARRGPGLVDLLPQPPERKSKLEQSIEDAANKDCRKAYAGAGLLAVVPLAVDAARGKGCKW